MLTRPLVVTLLALLGLEGADAVKRLRRASKVLFASEEYELADELRGFAEELASFNHELRS